MITIFMIYVQKEAKAYYGAKKKKPCSPRAAR
jgi:hypothetical protein